MGEIISVITGQAERSWGDRPGQSAIFGSGVVDHAHGFTMARLACRIGQRATAVIPPRRNRVVQRSHDRHLYKEHNLVERFFLIGSSNSEESQLVMKSWRVTPCRFSIWFVLIFGKQCNESRCQGRMISLTAIG